jgi:hypothetical protein
LDYGYHTQALAIVAISRFGDMRWTWSLERRSRTRENVGVPIGACWSLKLSGYSIEVLTMTQMMPRYDSGAFGRSSEVQAVTCSCNQPPISTILTINLQHFLSFAAVYQLEDNVLDHKSRPLLELYVEVRHDRGPGLRRKHCSECSGKRNRCSQRLISGACQCQKGDCEVRALLSALVIVAHR